MTTTIISQDNINFDEFQFLSKLDKDTKWLKKNYKEVQERYPNKFVAISNERILAADEDMEKVIEKTKEKGIKPNLVLTEFIPDRHSILIL